MESELDYTCIVCEKQNGKGIMICSQFICNDCESEIIRTDVNDAKYSFYIQKLKRIGYKNII
ncbi:sigma factor G inhibitor Gin [Chengkuizengella sp. 2205SS18-9]|uniref:Sigma factor G inhibitor Gin n=2 Tax=Chengkuizengella axinellae TaxID=3064388 RepID=A0ABT9J5M9_9BACL|nr:sigma factor G inhibitor Gin [Chengkuizengella sp. 2205SS18-9]MDP5276923.1 sigma factor G inhibitor Gin [Chengkuizengella sp. 2205SS18-9]